MGFRVENAEGISFLRSDHLSFVRHGFIGKSSDFSEAVRRDAERRFKEVFKVDELFLPAQIHGSNVLDLRAGGASIEGDAVIISKESKGIAVGVRTADCVPILVSTDDAYAVIHAGWRGLASGVIEETFRHLRASRTSIAAIGPSAGYEVYEVDDDVIEAIGSKGVFSRREDGKYLLSLEGTAEKILRSLMPVGAAVAASSICTISDSNYHSFRRDREHRGSNLGFIIP